MGDLERDANRTVGQLSKNMGCVLWLWPGLLILGVIGGIIGWLSRVSIPTVHISSQWWIKFGVSVAVLGTLAVVLDIRHRRRYLTCTNPG